MRKNNKELCKEIIKGFKGKENEFVIQCCKLDVWFMSAIEDSIRKGDTLYDEEGNKYHIYNKNGNKY